ncbi:thioredoxin domain-containing protein [Thermoleophilia bacterium SCSIO 60948]|nr:thioredoxin domain-containing protein [Thermoleophilia bacterium SCSIO 60948]
MTRNSKLSISILLFAAIVAAVIALGAGGGPFTSAPEPTADATVVRDSSHRLSPAPDSDVTVVEFLDFECEACGALYPVMEQLREEYDGEVEFVIRYFPLPSHFNSTNAALAVEAASKQGKLEEMYKLMFETQESWGEQQSSAEPLFRQFATELELDMEQFDADVASGETLERVELDKQDGEDLGIQGTPALYLNGEELQPGSFEQMSAEIDKALEGS